MRSCDARLAGAAGFAQFSHERIRGVGRATAPVAIRKAAPQMTDTRNDDLRLPVGFFVLAMCAYTLYAFYGDVPMTASVVPLGALALGAGVRVLLMLRRGRGWAPATTFRLSLALLVTLAIPLVIALLVRA